jgi:hypothetical protein
MVNKELAEKLNQLGVHLMTPQENLDVNETLAEVVKSHDTRLWENFSALVATGVQKYTVDFSKVQEQLNAAFDQEAFTKLLAVSKVMFENFPVVSSEANAALEKLSETSKEFQKQLEPVREALAHSAFVPVADLKLSTQRMKNFFEDYLGRVSFEEKKELSKHEELSMEFALSQVFSAKQKELFRKKLDGEKLTKTEREYFSRAVKRKVQALANPDLHRLAQKLLG